MPTLLPEEIKRYFDHAAETFAKNRWLGSAIAKQDHKITTEFLMDFLEVNTTDHVLEMGCGPGVWTNIVAELCCNLTAVDISGEMIEQGRNRVKKKNVTFCQSDFVEYQSSDSYNKIFSVRVIEYFQNPAKVAAKIYSLTKEGGKAVIITKTTPTLITMRAKLWQYIKELLPKKQGFFEKTMLPMKMIPPWRLKNIFITCGYKKVEVYPVVLRSPLFIHSRYPLPFVKEQTQKEYEQSMLIFFNKLSRKSKFLPKILRYLLLFFSETYLVVAEK